MNLTLKKAKRGWTWWGNWNNDENIEVTVPRRYAINVRTGGGSVELRDTVGTASIADLRRQRFGEERDGECRGANVGGSIHGETIKGDVDAGTSGGTIRLLQIDGAIRGKTSGGSVYCSLVGANRGISMTTSGGSIELTRPKATTGNLDAGTSGGNVSSELPVTSTDWGDHKLVGSLNGGGVPIYAHTSGGSISLRAEN